MRLPPLNNYVKVSTYDFHNQNVNSILKFHLIN